MKRFLHYSHKTLLVASLLLLIAGYLQPLRVLADDCTKNGMSQLDCDAIYGNWQNWIPLTGSDCGTTDDTDASLVGNGRVEQAYNFFVSKPGMTPQAAAGMVGNFQAESGQDIDPTTENDIGAYGIAQWLGSRRTALEAYAKNHGKPASDFGIQLSFSWHELTGGYKNSVLIPIEKAKTAKDAAYIVYDKYEVPGDGSDPAREANAIKIFNKYAGGSSGGAAVSASDPSTGDTSVNCSASSSSYTAGGSCTVTAPATLSQYSQAQLKKIFGDPGSASSHPDLHLTTVSFLGHNASVSPLVAPCLKAVSDQLTAEHTTYKIRLFGCYRFDSNNGTTNIGLSSYHTYGAACDINWDTNPIVLSGTAKHDMPQAWIKAFHDHGFTWGGTWNSKKDYMHFEFHGIKP
jgi:hypothetical protein